ncbi:MAG: archease [Candidatus Omnitrophica bacterium]|nr:archease [Candidatus Omnitrophota bacterium]
MKDYEIFEHTADLGVRVYGRDLQTLFKNAAVALFSLVVDSCPPQEKEITVKLEVKTLEDLLLNWLNELISVFFTYKFLPSGYNIHISKEEPYILRATLKGAGYDPYSQKVNTEIKAATYHGLKIEEVPEGFKAEIIFDV